MNITPLRPITSMYMLNGFYPNFDVEVDWLVTTVDGVRRTGGYRYQGTLMEVLCQMEETHEVGLLSDLEPHETASDRLNTIIEHNGSVVQFMIFDLINNRQLV